MGLSRTSVWPWHALVALILFAPAGFASVSMVDDAGHRTQLNQPANRVITLSPALAELTFDAGAGPQLVGSVEYSDYPPAANNIPRVGDAFHLDMERIAALHPDLVLAWLGGTPAEAIQRIRTLGIPVLSLGTRELGDIAGNLRMIGRATGHERDAAEASRRFMDQLIHLRKRYSQSEPIHVFYEISTNPLYTVGGSQPISQLLALCGGRNIFGELHSLAAPVSLEAVIGRNPQAIVTAADGPGTRKRLQAWRQWPELAAVQAGNLFSIPAGLITRATPRILEGGQRLCRDLEMARSRLRATASPY